MMYSSILFARYLIFYAEQSSMIITHRKLQGFSFIANSMHLALKGNSLIYEQPENWPSGPIFPKLSRHIAKEGLPSSSNMGLPALEERIVKDIFKVFGEWNDDNLMYWLIRDGSSWAKALEINREFNTTIETQWVIEEFNLLVNKQNING